MANSTQGESKPFIAKVMLSLGVVALIFIAAAIYREMAQKKEIQKKINALQQEAEQISRTNALTQDKIAYLESRDYQEREAKDKLNLQSPDEQTVVIKPTIAEKENKVEMESAPIVPVAVATDSNLRKWWNYFFKY